MLVDAQFLGGASPNADDREALAALGGVAPSVGSHPRTFAWYAITSKFTEEVRAKWTGGGNFKFAKPEPKAAAADSGQSAAAAGGEGGKKKEKKKGGISAKEQKKLDRLAKRQAEEAKKNMFVKDPNDPCADKFGDMELNRSQCDPELRFQRKYVAV